MAIEVEGRDMAKIIIFGRRDKGNTNTSIVVIENMNFLINM